MSRAREYDARHIKKGDLITADWLNKLVDAATRKSYSTPYDLRETGARIIVKNNTSATIPPYSLINADYDLTDPTNAFIENGVRLEVVDNVDAPFTVSNGMFEIINGASFVAVDLKEPQKVDGESGFTGWEVGQPVQRTNTAGIYTATQDGSTDGNIILLKEPEADGRVWVWEVGAKGSGVTLCHGIVVKSCDPLCNTYYVRRITRTLKTNCTDETGTGTGG